MISKTPLRISFVGGGSDLPWFAREHGGAVISTAIDKFVYVVVTERFEDELRISYTKTEIVDKLDDVQHELAREALRAAGLRRKLEIVTIADVPGGTGLGSSSAVTVGLLNALFAYQGILKSPAELAEEAAQIEIDVLGKPIGAQDHYASAHGGFQLLRFGPGEEVRRNPVVLPADSSRALERRLLLFYTGSQRAASDILDAVSSTDRRPETEARLGQLRDAALGLYAALGEGSRNGDLASLLATALDEGWQVKRSLAGAVSTPEIDAAYELALGEGALGGKLLGAGGGGFLLLCVQPERQAGVRDALAPMRELPFRLEADGSRIMYLGR